MTAKSNIGDECGGDTSEEYLYEEYWMTNNGCVGIEENQLELDEVINRFN